MFIITELGTPSVTKTLDASPPLSRLVVMKRAWSRCFALDREQRYQLVPSHELVITPMQRCLARLIYNPTTDVITTWVPAGPYLLSDIVSEVKCGLASDDDGIQQWFDAEDVLKVLRSATTFDEMSDAIRCVCGEFESDRD
ncbi:MAG: hypothetical protein V4662_06905 [Verrucomicrobiota bacterium]